MSKSYPTRSPLRRPFIVTPYTTDADGRLVAEMPACCPLSGSASEKPCRLAVDHHRDRKTGPRHPLAVVACHAHGCGFTLYPPGYAPYLRQPVLQVAPDGEHAPGDDRDEFADTVFEAAVDANAGRAWARITKDDPPERWWGTQGRHLRFAVQLVGIARDLADAVRETIAASLSVSTLVLREHSNAHGYRAIGRAVCDVLHRLRGGPRRAQQLLLCGHMVGHWGAPWQWDAKRQVMERSPFLRGGTTGGSSP
jgi:hypothetical protein